MKEEEIDVIELMNELISENSTRWDSDKESIRFSRNMAAGRAFDESTLKFWGTDRAQVNVPVLNSWVDQVVGLYNSNPFSLSVTTADTQSRQDLTNIKSIMQYIEEKGQLRRIVGDSIRDAVQDGLSYVLVYHEKDQYSDSFDIKFKLLNSTNVLFGRSEEPNGSDVEVVAHLDYISKKKAKELYQDKVDSSILRTEDLLTGYGVFSNSSTECSVTTLYHKHGDKVHIDKIVHSVVVEHTELTLPCIPIIRFTGKQLFVDDEKNWRGVYHLVSDLLRTINFSASMIQERIALTPATSWVLPEESVAGRGDQWSTANSKPRAFLSFKSYDTNGNPLLKPELINKSTNVADLVETTATFKELISNALGNPVAAVGVNETAEAVLTRKQTAETTGDKFMQSAADSMRHMAKVVLYFIDFIFTSTRSIDGAVLEGVENIENLIPDIENGPILATQKERTLQQIIAFGNVVSESPEKAKLAPVLLEYIDCSPEQRQYLAQTYIQQPQQGPTPEEMAALGTQMGQLESQIAQRDQYIQEMQSYIRAEEIKAEAKLLEAQMKIQAELQLALIKEQGLDDRQIQKIQSDMAKDIMEQERKVAELRAKQPINIVVPMSQPQFTSPQNI